MDYYSAKERNEGLICPIVWMKSHTHGKSKEPDTKGHIL